MGDIGHIAIVEVVDRRPYFFNFVKTRPNMSLEGSMSDVAVSFLHSIVYHSPASFVIADTSRGYSSSPEYAYPTSRVMRCSRHNSAGEGPDYSRTP